MTDKKSYFAVIPATVRYDDRLTPNAKLLFGEITALSNEKGFCWASNSYFAKLYGVSVISISKWVNQLITAGYLTSAYQYKEGTKEIEYRCLTPVYDPIKENFNTPLNESLIPPLTKVKDPIKEKFKENNTVNNTTNINTIVEYLNKRAGTKYQPNSKATVRYINARLNEKFTVDDFKVVIDKKCNEWIGTDMEKYIRPETLFGTKFESYLNAKTTNKRGDIDAKQRESIIDVAEFPEY